MILYFVPLQATQTRGQSITFDSEAYYMGYSHGPFVAVKMRFAKDISEIASFVSLV